MTIDTEKKKLSLRDFYFEDKYAEGDKMPIKLPSGEDSGEWLNIVSPESDIAVKAMRSYLRKYREITAELEPLKTKCEEVSDFTEYNLSLSERCAMLNHYLAVDLVNGWSFDEAFSKESLANLLSQYKALANHVADFHSEKRNKLAEK